jgi:transcriptional regulator with XRE-family HTH domain
MAARDFSFEALCEVCSIDRTQMTENERGRVNHALRQLRKLHPEDDYLLSELIRKRASAYGEVYPQIALTPQALLNAWSRIEYQATPRSLTNAPASGRGCPECGGDKWVDAGLDERGYPIARPCSTCQSPPIPLLEMLE